MVRYPPSLSAGAGWLEAPSFVVGDCRSQSFDGTPNKPLKRSSSESNETTVVRC